MVKQCSIPGVKYFSYNAVPEDAPYQNRYSPIIPRLRRAYGVAHKLRSSPAKASSRMWWW